jgi:hypothetical protein
VKITRREAISAGLATAAAGVGVDAFIVEPQWLQVSEHTVVVSGLPTSLVGFTVAQLSDVHLRGDVEWSDSIAAAVRQLDPQLVVMTGDLVESATGLPHLARLGSALRAPSTRVAAILGNWEHWGAVPMELLRRTYAGFGAELLVDEARRLDGVTLLATDDDLAGSPRLDALTAAASAETPRILLTHSPQLLDVAARRIPAVDLALAGHTHGGQARLGSLAPFCPPGSGRFVAGWYDTPVGPAYVSRGLGTSVAPVRFLCRPELPVFRFTRR